MPFPIYCKIKIGFLVTITLYMTTSACVLPSPLTLQLILEFSKWKGWDQVVLFDNVTSLDCAFTYIRPLIACLSNEGISVSIQSAINPNIPDALMIQRHRVGSIVMLDGLNLTSPDNVLHTASQKFLFNYYVSWLMITGKSTDTTIDTVLRYLNIGIDSDVIVATPSKIYETIQKSYQTYWNRTCSYLHQYGSNFIYRESAGKRPDENATMNLDYAILENRTVLFHFVHVYKIRYTDNASLVTNFLGSWNPDSWMVHSPISTKLRDDFKGLPIIFGILNGSTDGQTDSNDEQSHDAAPLLDFAKFVIGSVNASMELIPHDKLGTLNSKVWSNLLGDVVSGTVDIGLGYITVNDERQAEMSFSHPLIRYTRNVYYRPLETGTMRDIFRQPFNNILLACVASTYITILIAMIFVIITAKDRLYCQGEQRVWFGEAILWCISVMCMQGPSWTPRNPSGRTVALFSLMFTLVMYNAYAAFITSILSVQVNGIKSMTDILSRNFKLGYSVFDDEYIRNANDSNLRELYIRAFNNRESGLDTVSGLKKAMEGQYAFFVSAHLARRALKSTLIQERCTLMELPVPQTFTVVALPMANSCPYKKIINLNILRIRERGVFNRLTEQMLPELPQCKSSNTFLSARLADVYSAFFILVAGVIMAVSIGTVERLWNKRKQMRDTIVRGMQGYNLMPSYLSNFPRLSTLSQISTLAPFASPRNAEKEYPCEDGPQSNAIEKGEYYGNEFFSSLGNIADNASTISKKTDVNLGDVKDQPHLQPKMFVVGRQNKMQGELLNPLSDLQNKKLNRDEMDASRDNTVYPFQE